MSQENLIHASFLEGTKPSPEELAVWEARIPSSVTGKDARKNKFALQADRAEFGKARGAAEFQTLIGNWQERGVIFSVLRHFEADEQTLPLAKPAKPRQKPKSSPLSATANEADRTMQVREDIALSRIRTENIRDGVEGLSGWARYVPHALVGGAVALTAYAGWQGVRNAEKKIPQRREAIIRQMEDLNLLEGKEQNLQPPAAGNAPNQGNAAQAPDDPDDKAKKGEVEKLQQPKADGRVR